mmetsp:Transcript_20702/g.53029  ORF Transcript_20702/g.53029 Transcript_20702/m.53029 type:complete len:345 (-) Transcript_20702:101-1135(-)
MARTAGWEQGSENSIRLRLGERSARTAPAGHPSRGRAQPGMSCWRDLRAGCLQMCGMLCTVLLAVPRSVGGAVSDGAVCSLAEQGSGWHACGVDAALLTEECTLDRVPESQMTQELFDVYYRDRRPVIIVGTRNEGFREQTRKERLLREFGDVVVTLSTANTISHKKTPIKLGSYIAGMHPHDRERRGNETLYLFGPNTELGNSLGGLIAGYSPPRLADDDLAFSFGIGASGSGVPFHVHGPGWSEVVHGRKRWLLYPPGHSPHFDPDGSSAAWVADVLPTLGGSDLALLEDCVIGPGEALYFPSMWWHATVNIGEGVFMSSFEPNRKAAAAQGEARQRRSSWV